jgi:hypothetical protein
MKVKSILFFAGVILCISLFTSCKYDTQIAHPEKYVKIYMPEAQKSPQNFIYEMSDKPDTIIYGASYGGTGYPKKDITVQFGVDKALVDSFNIKHDTHYQPMPEGSYDLESKSSVIPNGKLSTKPLSLTIKTEGILEPSTKYLLPLKIVSTDRNIPISKTLRVKYNIIAGVIPVSSDSSYTDFNRDNWEIIDFDYQDTYDGNLAVNAIDGDTTTDWQTEWKASKPGPPHWITIDMHTKHVIHGFYFYPRESQVGKTGNPKDVHIDISSNGEDWESAGDFELVDKKGRQNIYFKYGLPARYFKITINKSFKDKYLVHIAEIGGF